MNQDRVREIVRQFPENSTKQLLHNPGNVRDLLSLEETPLLDRMLLDDMQVDPTSYVSADYRHVISDLVLSVPLRPRKGSRARRRLWLTILLEHQSNPDRLILPRILDYLAQVWKAQARQWAQKYGSLASVKLRPILPVVFYTGTYRWERLGSLLDLMDLDEEAREMLEGCTPGLKPTFINLPAISSDRLTEKGGFFGRVLQLVQARQASRSVFRALLGQVVSALEEMPDSARLRWLELLSYLQGLVYHQRKASEHEELEQVIESSVRTDEHRQEANMAWHTIAQAVREEEGLRLRKAILQEQIRERFDVLPANIEQVIAATQDLERLDAWLRRFATAKTLEDIGIIG
jgi:hypothetical protein